jgi:nitrogenase molybdenum-iron protein alpha/beta subunit
MALYAANNILKGISNFNDNGFRVAGIIHNSRGTLNEGIRVRAFADAVGLPVVVTIPRSEDFASAEKEGCTLAELSLDCALLDIFKDLAHHVESLAAGSAQLYPALPLEDDRLEVVVLGKTRRSFKTRSHASPSFQKERTRDEFPFADKGNMFLTKSMKHKQPLRGCSFAGAVTATSHVYNALTIAHGPRSCAHIVSHFLTSTSLSARSRYGTPLQTSMYDLPVPTDMGEKAFIFGGADELRHTMELAVNRGYKTIFVVSTCPPGLIGDDIDRIAGDMKQCYTDTRFVTVPVDGNIAGDFAQGLVEGYRKVLELADNSVKVKERTVNIIGEKVLSSNAGYNYDTIKKLLDEIGLQVNCRFLYHAGVEDIASICRAEFNLLAHNDESGKVLKEYLQSELGCEFLGLPFPIGFRESAEWLELLAERFCMEDKAREMIRVRKELYDSEISKLRPALRGKRLLISSFNPDIDWVIETALDLGMHVLKVGLAFSPETIDFRSRYIGMLPVDFDYDFKKRDRDITELAPDLILSNYPPLIHKAHAHHDSIPISPDVGFNTGLVMARRWDTLLKLPVAEGWRIDGDDTHDN